MNRNVVSMCKMTGLAAAAALLALAGTNTALAQFDAPPDFFYHITYYSNAHTTGAPDATLRLVNDGFRSDHSPDGDLCASIFVFDNNEEMLECCSCKITPNGLLTLSVNTNLTSSTLTSKIPSRGVIKTTSWTPRVDTLICDPTLTGVETGPASAVPGIHGWITHIQKAGTTFPQTEEELTDATIGEPELVDLLEDCGVLIELGSGKGVCDCRDAGR